jgi:enolase
MGETPDTAIRKVHGRRLWDSRGHPTVEAEVTLAGGGRGRAIAPAGASRGSNEAIDLRDGGTRFGGLDVRAALGSVNGPIQAALAGMDAANQEAVDARLIECDGSADKSRLGGNATVAVSLAVLHAAAAANDVPVWRHLAGCDPVALPLPEIQILGGGAHAGGRVDIQDFMVAAPGAESFTEALDITAEIYAAAGRLLAADGRRYGVADEGGWWPAFDSNEAALEFLVRAIEAAGFIPGDKVGIALDIAASEFGADGRYRLALDRRDMDRDGWIELLLRWLERYPILSLEDPLAEDDWQGMAAFTKAAGAAVQIVGDDFITTDAERLAAAAAAGAGNAVLIKPNQIGTVSEAKATLDAARAAGWGAIVSARSGETEDVSVAHLAIGWRVGQLKVGSFARSERMAKWNECLRIEEQLGDEGGFAGGLPYQATRWGRRQS